MLVRNIFLGLIAGSLLVVPGSSFAQAGASGVESEVLKANDSFVKAHLAGDVDALNRILTDSFTHTHASGVVEDKADFLKTLKPFKTLDLSNVVVRMANNKVAVVTGQVFLTCPRCESGTQSTFLEVWVLNQQGWQCAAWTTTPLPKKAEPPSSK